MKYFKGSLESAAELMVRGLEQEVKAAVMQRLREVVEEEFEVIAKQIAEKMAHTVVQIDKDLVAHGTRVFVQFARSANG